MGNSDLFYIPKPNTHSAIKLFCFPFAGGNSSSFIPWLKSLSPDVELICIQLPGRGVRFDDAPYNSMDALTDDLLTEIIPLIDKPYVFLGYSLGAKVAFELARKLKNIGFPLPVHFMALASPAPFIPRKVLPIHNLPDKEFIRKLGGYNGTPAEVLDDDDLMEILLPALRADFTILETYRAQSHEILSTKLTTMGGEQDVDVHNDDLLAWQSIFKHPVQHTILPGGHFFINESMPLLLREVDNILRQEIALTKKAIC